MYCHLLTTLFIISALFLFTTQSQADVYKRLGETNAGAASISAIDFGTVAKGETAGGLGLGTGDTGASVGAMYAVGAGLKHGVDDDTAVIIKGYYGTRGHSNAVGAGVVHKF